MIGYKLTQGAPPYVDAVDLPDLWYQDGAKLSDKEKSAFWHFTDPETYGAPTAMDQIVYNAVASLMQKKWKIAVNADYADSAEPLLYTSDPGYLIEWYGRGGATAQAGATIPAPPRPTEAGLFGNLFDSNTAMAIAVVGGVIWYNWSEGRRRRSSSKGW